MLFYLKAGNICALVTPPLYVIFMPAKCYKCSHICCSLRKMQMHHLLRKSPPVAELSPLIIDSCSQGKLTNWTPAPVTGPYGFVEESRLRSWGLCSHILFRRVCGLAPIVTVGLKAALEFPVGFLTSYCDKELLFIWLCCCLDVIHFTATGLHTFWATAKAAVHQQR